jgi:hypothetical protein
LGVELVYDGCIRPIIRFLLFGLQFLYVRDVGRNLDVFEHVGVVQRVVLDYVHLLQGFADVDVVRNYLVGHRQTLSREKL